MPGGAQVEGVVVGEAEGREAAVDQVGAICLEAPKR
jgi:hypothetical protein